MSRLTPSPEFPRVPRVSTSSYEFLRVPLNSLFLLLGLLCLTACRPDTPPAGPRLAADWQATPFASRTPISTVTPTIIETTPTRPLPTLAPTPTWGSDGLEEIPTLAPTPIRPGVYRRESDGFTVFYPSDWDVGEESDDTLVIFDPSLGLTLVVESRTISDETSYGAYLDYLLSEDFGLVGASLLSEDEITFAGSGTAQTALITGEAEDGTEYLVRLAYAEQGAHTYAFYAYGTPPAIEARETTFNMLVNQAQLGSSQIYGLNRDETLVLLGFDPDERALDPARTTGSADGYVGLLYSGLVRLSPELQVVPDLAERWDISADGTVYTFTLRANLEFADGSPLTAEDVRYSLERAADPDTGSTTARTYLGDILGVADVLDEEADSIEGLEVVDERTIVMTLDGPKPYFLAKLTYPTAFIVDEESVDGEPDDEWPFEPNPSGPYLLREYSEAETLIFERNPAYYQPAGIPYVVYLNNRFGSSISLFESGEIDVVYLDATETAEVRRPSHVLHDQWVSVTSMCTGLVQMNNTLAPLDDVNVRRALALAVDKDGLNDLLADGLNLRSDTILPPAMPGYSLELAQAQAATTFDAAAAQAALAASSYGTDLPPITVHASGFGNEERDDVNALVADWREVLGIEVNVEFLDPSAFTGAARDESAHLVFYGWCADYPDPQNFLDILYHSNSEFNVAGYSNPELDALIEEAGVELDPAQRLALYQELERRLLEDGAGIPLLHNVSDALVSSRIQGTVIVPIGAPVIPYLSLLPAPAGGE